jgi:indolepyruvate ferredoxin oxidoreductase, beta subunit
VKQRIVLSGKGGQGVLTLTRVVAEAAAAAGLEVITTETHGMAQRGGAVLSTIKVGAFHGPLIAPGEAEVGLFLHADNLPVHGHYLRPGGAALVNGSGVAGADGVDADRLATLAGQPRAANLALLGYAAGKGVLFAGPDLFEETIRKNAPAKYLDQNLAAFRAGVDAAR